MQKTSVENSTKDNDKWRKDEDMVEITWTGNNRKQMGGDGGVNVIVWVQREPPRPPVQSHFVVKSLAGGLSPTWLSGNDRLPL